MMPGEWKHDLRDGVGTFTFVKPLDDNPLVSQWAGSYEGEWKANKKHGKGVFKYPNGDKYEGQWRNDQKTGQGVYTFKNGDKYEGKFANNMFHGEGVMICANGTIVKGTWDKDKLHGKVRTMLENGEEVEEIYNRGERKGRRVVDGTERPSAADSMDDLIKETDSGDDKKSKTSLETEVERKQGKKAVEQKTATYAKAAPSRKGKNDDEEFLNPSEMLDVGL
uniref:MORN repeat-containing protein 5 n=1 Tax=Lotharella globosa TaxID=91324 RepID=A0A7S3YDZ5_9EUKA